MIRLKLRHCSLKIPVLLLCGVVSGCAGRVITPYEPGSAHPVAVNVAVHRQFAYDPSPLVVEALSAPEPAGKHYSRQRLRFSARQHTDSNDFSLEADYYRGKGEGPRHLVIVVPVWGEALMYRYPSASFRWYMQSRSDGRFDIMQIDGSNQLLVDWDGMSSATTPAELRERAEHMVDRIRQAVVGIRRMVDWAQAQPRIDNDSVAIAGFSMGAVVSSLALGADDRFAAGAIVMGGGELAEIFSNCQGRVGAIRESITQRFGWTTDEYKRFFRDVLQPGDPSNFRGHYDPGSILYLDAMYDDCMPRRARNAMWKLTGKPRRITFISGHRGAFLALTPLTLNYGHRKIYDFLSTQLNESR